MQFTLLLVASLIAVAFGVGYAPVPQIAPAPTSYGNPSQQQLQPLQPVYVPQGQVSTFNTVPRVIQPQGFVQPQGTVVTGNGVVPSVAGTGPVSSLTSEDDWENIISARGVKTLRGNRRH